MSARLTQSPVRCARCGKSLPPIETVLPPSKVLYSICPSCRTFNGALLKSLTSKTSVPRKTSSTPKPAPAKSKAKLPTAKVAAAAAAKRSKRSAAAAIAAAAARAAGR